MGDTTEQIERDIQSKHADLRANLEELKDKVQSITDWRQQFRNHPAAMSAAAFGGGILLATVLGHNNGRRPRVQSSNAPQALAHSEHSGIERTKHEVRSAWDHIASALIGVAASKVTGVLAEVVPGFKGQLDTAEKRRERRDTLNPESPAKV